MNGIVRVQLGGQERVLRFNNFANIEIAKVLFQSETAKPDLPKFLDALFALNSKNHFLLLKMLVYAGLIGNDYVVGFQESATPEQVGEWIADAHPDVLSKVWESFLEASGMTLTPEKEKDNEAAHTAKKKTSKPTKKRYQKPSENLG